MQRRVWTWATLSAQPRHSSNFAFSAISGYRRLVLTEAALRTLCEVRHAVVFMQIPEAGRLISANCRGRGTPGISIAFTSPPRDKKAWGSISPLFTLDEPQPSPVIRKPLPCVGRDLGPSARRRCVPCYSSSTFDFRCHWTAGDKDGPAICDSGWCLGIRRALVLAHCDGPKRLQRNRSFHLRQTSTPRVIPQAPSYSVRYRLSTRRHSFSRRVGRRHRPKLSKCSIGELLPEAV
jgi:hypothetical protein